MSMALSMVCVPQLKMSQRLSLKKKCPKCGWLNDLREVIEVHCNIVPTMPLCFRCGESLWKFKGFWVKYWRGRKELRRG